MNERYYVVIRRTKSPKAALKLTRSLCRAGIEHIVLADGRVAVRGCEIRKVKLRILHLDVVDEEGKQPDDCLCFRQSLKNIAFKIGQGGIIEVPEGGEVRYLNIGGGPKKIKSDPKELVKGAIKLGFIKKDVLH